MVRRSIASRGETCTTIWASTPSTTTTSASSESGSAIAARDGSFTKQVVFDDDTGRGYKHVYLDDNDKPVIRRDEGVAGWWVEFDPQGNEVGYKYFGLR